MKKVKWNDKAKVFIRSLPINVKQEIGSLIMILQNGGTLGEPQSKPMKIIHKNAYEIRVKDRNGIYRVIYILKFEDRILIPHAFVKKSKKTPKKEIDLSIKRLKELLNEVK